MLLNGNGFLCALVITTSRILNSFCLSLHDLEIGAAITKTNCLEPFGKQFSIQTVAERLQHWNSELNVLKHSSSLAGWNWQVNMTDENAKKSTAANIKEASEEKRFWHEAGCFNDCKACSSSLRRQLKLYQSGIGVSALDEKKLSLFQALVQNMSAIYSKAKLCNLTGFSKGSCFSLDPDLSGLLRRQGDYCLLTEVWKGWRDATGKHMRNHFIEYSNLVKEAAQRNGFENGQEMWLSDYTADSPDFLEEILALWKDVKPLYQQLHAFVRSKLIGVYGSDKFPTSGHIPAHLLGNMWAQDWTSLLNLVLPKPLAPSVNLTTNLQKQNFTVRRLFEMADQFFQSLGMEPMTDDFWTKSVLTRRPDVDMVCHASAWDLNRSPDFRIKMCTTVDETNFQTVHHEMGHIQYFMHYRDQPLKFRESANPGFHEALGDLIAISATNPLHLKAVGLLTREELKADNEDDILLNGLMLRALAKVAFLPFGLLVDLYRYGVFTGETTNDRLNTDWWKLRCSLQGVSPPVIRSEEDFDPGSKYHIPASSAYLNYFVAALLQFDFHESICRRIGFTENFHKCDIWNNANAAQVLREMMALGRSKPHPVILKVITGRDRMSAAPMLRFFKPLYDWLVERNTKSGVSVGWDESECPSPMVTCS